MSKIASVQGLRYRLCFNFNPSFIVIIIYGIIEGVYSASVGQRKRNLIMLFAEQFFIRISTATIKQYLLFFLQEPGVSLSEKIAFWTRLLSSVNFLTQALFSSM